MLSTLVEPFAVSEPVPGQSPTPWPPDPSEEAPTFLGQAWRSSSPTPVLTGRTFDLLRVREASGRLVLDYLQRRGLRRGAVFADHGSWHFFVPLGSHILPPGMDWPPAVTYLTGRHVTIPARGARAGDRTPLHWITRDPAGHLFTAPTALWAASRVFTTTPDTTATAPEERPRSPRGSPLTP